MESYGYRFGTADRTLVIAGDTTPTQATIDVCRGCDVLIHEASTPARLETRPDSFQQFAARYHTTTTELAELGTKAMLKLLILDHYASLSPEELQDEMHAFIQDASWLAETLTCTDLRHPIDAPIVLAVSLRARPCA